MKRTEAPMDRCEDNPITIDANPKRVRVLFNGRVVADSTGVLTLHEPGLPPVQYIPRADADMALLERTAHKTHCGYKGDAAYDTIRVDGRTAADAIWTYEDPLSGALATKDHLAFYPDHVDRIEEFPA
jgi:uncharacterized protein (DUF427 family)